MNRETKLMLNEAIERMVAVLEPRHWRALAAAKGVKYPYSLVDKIRVLKSIILNETCPELVSGKEAKDV